MSKERNENSCFVGIYGLFFKILRFIFIFIFFIYLFFKLGTPDLPVCFLAEQCP